MTNKKTILVVLAAGVGLSVALIGSCAGLLYVGFQRADTAVSPRIDALFLAIENESFAATYESETAQELRNVATQEQYTALGEAIRVRLGRLQSKSLQGFNMRQTNDQSYIEVSYQAAFEHGPGTIFAKLKNQDGMWKFVSFRVESPVFEQDL